MYLTAAILVLFEGTKMSAWSFWTKMDVSSDYIMWWNLLIHWGSRVRMLQVWGQDVSLGQLPLSATPVATCLH